MIFLFLSVIHEWMLTGEGLAGLHATVKFKIQFSQLTNLQSTKEEDWNGEAQSTGQASGSIVRTVLHVILIAEIIPVPVTDTELPSVFVSLLVLHWGVVVAPGGVEVPVVGGGIEAVHDLLAVGGEEVAAHCLVCLAGSGLVVRNLPTVAEDTAAVRHWVGCGHIALVRPVVTEFVLTDTDGHLLVMEAVLVVAEVTLVTARTSELLVLVLEVPALRNYKVPFIFSNFPLISYNFRKFFPHLPSWFPKFPLR